MGTREQMVSRIWNSTDLWSDLAELCGFGGRFCGTPSEARAREYLRERLAAATGAPVTGRRIGYEGWQRESCRLAAGLSALNWPCRKESTIGASSHILPLTILRLPRSSGRVRFARLFP